MTEPREYAPALIPIAGTDWGYLHFSVDDGEGGGPKQWVKLSNRLTGESVEVRLRDLTWILQEYVAKQKRGER